MRSSLIIYSLLINEINSIESIDIVNIGLFQHLKFSDIIKSKVQIITQSKILFNFNQLNQYSPLKSNLIISNSILKYKTNEIKRNLKEDFLLKIENFLNKINRKLNIIIENCILVVVDYQGKIFKSKIHSKNFHYRFLQYSPISISNQIVGLILIT